MAGMLKVHEKIYRIRRKESNGVQSRYVPELPVGIFDDPNLVSIDEYIFNDWVFTNNKKTDSYKIKTELRDCKTHGEAEFRRYRVREKNRPVRYQWRCMECLAAKRKA